MLLHFSLLYLYIIYTIYKGCINKRVLVKNSVEDFIDHKKFIDKRVLLGINMTVTEFKNKVPERNLNINFVLDRFTDPFKESYVAFCPKDRSGTAVRAIFIFPSMKECTFMLMVFLGWRRYDTAGLFSGITADGLDRGETRHDAKTV